MSRETFFQNVMNLCGPESIWNIRTRPSAHYTSPHYSLTFRLAFLEKFLPQSVQGKTSTGPLCFSFLWPNRDLLEVKSFPQSGQINRSMFPCTSLERPMWALIRWFYWALPVVSLDERLDHIGVTQLADDHVSVPVYTARLPLPVLLDQVEGLLVSEVLEGGGGSDLRRQ